MADNNIIAIDDGTVTYKITNKEGKELGVFSFNPSDTNIIHRYEEVAAALENLEAELKGRREEENFEETLKNMEAVICEKIDYLLNGDVSKEFFKIAGPFSPLESGQVFVESVLDAIGQAINKETGARVKKIQSKIRRHTEKYHE